MQIALGCEDGWIYLIGGDYAVNKFIRVGYTVTKIHPLGTTYQGTQPILCCGHFNSLKLYSNGEVRNLPAELFLCLVC